MMTRFSASAGGKGEEDRVRGAEVPDCGAARLLFDALTSADRTVGFADAGAASGGRLCIQGRAAAPADHPLGSPLRSIEVA